MDCFEGLVASADGSTIYLVNHVEIVVLEDEDKDEFISTFRSKIHAPGFPEIKVHLIGICPGCQTNAVLVRSFK